MKGVGRVVLGRGLAGADWVSTVRASLRALKKALKYRVVWVRLLSRAARHGVSFDKLERVRMFHQIHYWGAYIPNKHPLQNPRSSYLPGLRARPIYDAGEIAWTARLEAAYPEIKREALALLEATALQPHPQRLADAGSWLTSYFYVQGEELEATHKACPATSSVLKSCFPLGLGEQVFFSVLSGGAHIRPHCGPWNTRLTCHLGLVVPDGASMRVGTEIVQWQEGKCLVFDDSFEHEVWNRSDERRIVLLIQFWHPDLTPDETWALKELVQLEGADKYKQAVKQGKRLEDLDRLLKPADG
jgi:aspartyl/asparaginyl beta-hydroxylase (cupin superfamily)